MFVLSFAHPYKRKNSLNLNIAYSYALIYNIMERLSARIPIDSDKIKIFISHCEVRSLSNIMALKEKGAKNIYLSGCTARFISPRTFKAFRQMFDIRPMTNPKADLESIL